MNIPKLPSFDELPLREGDPPYSAWGLWSNSQLGSLNYLTSERTLDAAKNEIMTGERIALKYVALAPPVLLLGDMGYDWTFGAFIDLDEQVYLLMSYSPVY